MNRRKFIKKTAASAAGLLAYPHLALADKSFKRIPKTDTHVHLFDLQNLSYGWLKNVPEINRDFSIRDFKKASRRSKIGKILFMESGADAGLGLKEAKWVSTLVKKEPRIKGIIAKLDLRKGKDAIEELEQLRALPLLKGIRGPFPNEADQSASFLAGLKFLAQHNLSFDFLLSPPRLETARKIAKKCPDNVFVLDHFGNPDIKGGELEFWKKGIRQLAEIPNVNCKMSGIITRAGKGWTTAMLKPYVDYVIERFGPDRLVYGGDWPVVLRAGSYRSWSAAFEELTRELSLDEKRKIYHKNADRVYRLMG